MSIMNTKKSNMKTQVFKILIIFAISNIYTITEASDNIRCIAQYSYDRIDKGKRVGVLSWGYQRVFYDSTIIETWYTKTKIDSAYKRFSFDFNSDTARVVRYHYNENRIYQNHRDGVINTIFDRAKFEERKPIIHLESALTYHDSMISYNVYYPVKKTKYNGISAYKFCDSDIWYHYVKIKNPKAYGNDGQIDLDYVLDSLANVDYSSKIERLCIPFYYNFKYGIVSYISQYGNEYRIHIFHESEGCKDFKYEH
jgi:hypothetical protein